MCVCVYTVKMISDYFAPTCPKQLPLGKCFDGRLVYRPIRSTVVQMAHFLTPHLDGIAGQAAGLPLPNGMSLGKSDANGHLHHVLADAYTRRLRRVFGYIGEITLGRG